MNHIFYQTKTNYSNTGDALINNALINKLREYGKIHANCSKDVPPEFLKALGILEDERVNYGTEFEFVKAVIKCAIESNKKRDKVYVFSGLGDMYGKSVKLAIRNFVSGLIFPVFRAFGVRIVRIGRSLGPISRLMAVSEWIRSLFVSHYYVRDTVSLERCRKIGIKKAKVCPDMSWLFDEQCRNKINNTGIVMVNLRNSIFDDVDDVFVETTVKSCESVLAEMNRFMNGEMKLCIAHQIKEDEEFSKKIYNYFKDKYPTEYIDHQMKLDELSYWYGKTEYHISNRMHSLLAGYKYGSLPIALIDADNHTKISSTLCDCGLEEIMLDIYDEGAQDKVKLVTAKKDALMEKLFLCETENRNKIKETLDIVFANRF